MTTTGGQLMKNHAPGAVLSVGIRGTRFPLRNGGYITRPEGVFSLYRARQASGFNRE